MDTFAVAVIAGSLADAQKKVDDVAAACDAGRYGVMVGNFKVCPLCASGTSGDGYGCTSCDAGTAAAVGATSCSNCVAGSYAQGGEWTFAACLPPACCCRLLLLPLPPAAAAAAAACCCCCCCCCCCIAGPFPLIMVSSPGCSPRSCR